MNRLYAPHRGAKTGVRALESTFCRRDTSFGAPQALTRSAAEKFRSAGKIDFTHPTGLDFCGLAGPSR
jgi:hypothetical protein